ncbi:MAG TPA: single-stranded-DNA-specific exonuclease RecJ [Bryobacteraceae bacterium]|jgi:single-stranded-DNA-specific exonuclease|nr:single-stranded-DNA-specific exonuclease RecJ [Bryobacteraceae bacterium]
MSDSFEEHAQDGPGVAARISDTVLVARRALCAATVGVQAARWTRPAARWNLPPVSRDPVERLARELSIDRVTASVLVHRGLGEPTAAREFLSPQLTSLGDPMLMRDMPAAVERLLEAVREKQPILLYGDYDVDGTTSIVVLKKAIELLGGQADFHVPHRLKEGYGMRSEVVEQAAVKGVRLIISVDTGIRANEVVRHAMRLGMDVIVTDHHLPETDLPPALAVLNPNRLDCGYPEKGLCGAGVTLKLVQALLIVSGLPVVRQSALLESFLKPVAIATVADIVPLVGENRVIVRRGLSGLRSVRNPGLRALLAVSGFAEGEAPSAHQVGFRVAPRINAAGRMASAADVIELFLTEDEGRARTLAGELDALNRERQLVESEIVESILKQCDEAPFDLDCAALVFAQSGWHLGVLGIVASRLVERFSRPAFVLSDAIIESNGEECFSGSGRSVPGFHLLEALESMPELFTKFGGHRQAAGLTLRPGQVDEFRRRLREFASNRLGIDELRPRYEVDAEAPFPELTDRAVANIFSLGPFGFGNASPLFCARQAQVAGPLRVLKEGKHFKVPLRHQGRLLFCNAWNFGDRSSLLQQGNVIDVLYQIEDDPYARARGEGSWCLTLKDVRPG